MTKGRLFFVLPFFLVLALGCGGSNRSAPASLSGKVTYKGSPVTAGMLTLYTNEAGVYSASLGADGTFSASDLPAGDAVVTVDTESANPNRKVPQYGDKRGGDKGATSPPPEGVQTGGAAKGSYVKIPAKYSDKSKSGLTVTLTKGKNQKDFELTD